MDIACPSDSEDLLVSKNSLRRVQKLLSALLGARGMLLAGRVR